MKVSEEVICVLRGMEIDGNMCRITDVLPREIYTKTAKVLKAMGGKWVSAKKCTVFPEGTDVSGTISQIIASREFISLQQEYQFFPTPDALAVQLIELAGIDEGDRCLEPSAGRGNIAKYMPGCDCIELNPDNAAYLTANGFNVIASDFMEFVPPESGYDVIVMNPPFCKGQDAAHVTKAISIARKCVVAVMSGSTLWRQDKVYREFRELVERHGGYLRELPQDSFKESGTAASTCVAVVRK